MQAEPHYDDLLGEVRAFFDERIAACLDAGIRRAPAAGSGLWLWQDGGTQLSVAGQATEVAGLRSAALGGDVAKVYDRQSAWPPV